MTSWAPIRPLWANDQEDGEAEARLPGLALLLRLLTSETVDIEAVLLAGEASLIGEEEEGLDSWQAPTTALAGSDDGVAHTAVSQPAGAASVQATIPGCIELARTGNLCAPFQTVVPSLLPCQFTGRGT